MSGKFAPTKTYWEKNPTGDLIHVGHADPAWRTVTRLAHEFPMGADQVAALMNDAFKSGMKAKAAEVRAALEMGSA